MSERDMSEVGAQHTLGQLIDGNARRDAVHIAVAPVRAGDHLSAGQFISVDGDGIAHKSTEPVGIVDPFLKRGAKPGEWFWLWLTPNTITGLRHQWTHPVLDPVDKGASETWLRNFIESADCPNYATVMAAAVGGKISVVDEVYGPDPYKNDGEYLHFRGRDAHGEIPEEFWDHVEIVTGHKIARDKRARAWSCSC